MLKIRLMRIGAKKRPFYRVVAVDERSKRTGGYIELLGTYNPLTKPHDIKLKKDRIDHWVKQGAQMSTGYLRMIGKAPQRPPRKPKKEQKKETAPAATEAAPQAEPVETLVKEAESETAQPVIAKRDISEAEQSPEPPAPRNDKEESDKPATPEAGQSTPEEKS